MIWIAIAAIVFFLDCLIKKWAEKELSSQKRKDLGRTGFSLKLTHNYGFAGNRLDKKPFLVKMLHSAIVAVLGVYAVIAVFFQKGKTVTSLGMAFLLGGGMSNLYDRIKRGYVVDYLGLPKMKKLLFNLSDLFVFLGSLLVLLGEWLGE